MTKPTKPPADLMDETERLARSVVRRARQGRVTVDPETQKRKRVPLDILDQVRALDSALKFLRTKQQLEPEDNQDEFSEQLRDFHNQGSGHTDSAKNANGGSSTTH